MKMTHEQFHYIVTRLNSINGNLSNHADGIKSMTQDRADDERKKCEEIMDMLESFRP
jgi:DNA-binding FrmR family transcriptional regulator